jgi:integrase
MATKVRQKNGKWWVFIDHKGKRKAKCVGDKRAAERLKAKLDAKIALGDFEISDEKEQRPFAT